MTWCAGEQKRTWGNNVFANRHLSVAVGCSNTECTERSVCWAMRNLRRRKPYCAMRGSMPCLWPSKCAYFEPGSNGCKHLRGCQCCYDGEVHDHFERRFRAETGERIAYSWGGDLFDEARDVQTILRHFGWMAELAMPYVCVSKPRFLIQTRRMGRLIEMLLAIEGRLQESAGFSLGEICEVGTTFSSDADLENVKALAELPGDVVRFLAFEPFPGLLMLDEDLLKAGVRFAKPNWAYIGPRTPVRLVDRIHTWFERLGDFLQSVNCKVIYKRSCGEELCKRNKGVELP